MGRPRSDTARKAILDATFSLLTESRGTRLTVEGIAGRAGVSKQTIYRWWKSAAHVAEEATKQDIKIHERNVDTGSLEGDLRHVLLPLVQRLDEATLPAIRTFVKASIDDPEFARVLHGSIMAPFWQTLGDVLRRGISRGELPRDLSVGPACEQILGAIIFRAIVHVSVSEEAFINGVIRSWVWPVSNSVRGGIK